MLRCLRRFAQRSPTPERVRPAGLVWNTRIGQWKSRAGVRADPPPSPPVWLLTDTHALVCLSFFRASAFLPLPKKCARQKKCRDSSSGKARSECLARRTSSSQDTLLRATRVSLRGPCCVSAAESSGQTTKPESAAREDTRPTGLPRALGVPLPSRAVEEAPCTSDFPQKTDEA